MTPLLLLLLLHGASSYAPPTVQVVSANDRPRKESTPLNRTQLDALLQGNGSLHLRSSLRDVILHCHSSQPVRWNFSGLTAPLDLNLTFHRDLPLNSPQENFVARLRIRRVSSHITGHWSCGHVAPPHEATSLHIFADEHSYLGTPPFLLQYGLTTKLLGRPGAPLTFPCVSWSRTADIKLAQLIPDPNKSALVPRVLQEEFDPTRGFLVKAAPASFFDSTFLCYENYTATVDKLWFTLERDYGIVASPPTNGDVLLVEGQTLQLNCTAEDPSVQFEFKVAPNPIGRFTIEKFEVSGTTHGRRFVMPNVGIHDKGTVTCIAKRKTSADAEPLSLSRHKWSYQVFYAEDERRRGLVHYRAQSTGLDNWVCRSKSSAVPSVAFVRCTNPMECDVRSACFRLSALCDPIDSRGCSGGCILLQVSNTPGIMSCTGDGVNATEQITFGVSTSPFQWYNASSGGIKSDDRLLATRVKQSETSTYTGENVTYSCKGSAMFFTLGFHWSILLTNGSSFRLDDQRREIPGVASLASHSEELLVAGVIVVDSTVAIHSLEAKGISCVAPHWDSPNASHFLLPLNMSRSVAPMFLGGVNEASWSGTLGQSEQLIPCDIDPSVRPPPSIRWTRDGRPIHNGDNQFSIHADGLAVKGGVTNDIAGEYKCIVSNAAGESSRQITVSVKDAKTKVIIGVSVAGVIGVLLLLVLLFFFWRRIQKQKEMLRNLTEAEIQEFLYGNPEALDSSGDTNRQGHLLAYNRDYEFPKDFLLIQSEEKLGAGAYGLVLKGTARGLFSDNDEEETTVAVKTLQANADITYFKALLMELKIMSVIGRNPFILNLLGACTTGIRNREIYIIVEFCGNGSLDAFLKAHRSDFPQSANVRYSTTPTKASVLLYENTPPHDRVTKGTMIRWSFEIARGMEYLESKKVIHGDLAARNVLLTDNLQAKIGDFGLSRQLYEYTNYVKKNQAPLPWRWMALESLTDMEFSHKSDVWAYGVTLWEIFSLGELPYPGLSWTEDFMRRLRQGHRPSQPPLADTPLFDRMSECWAYDARNRPSFSTLGEWLRGVMQKEGVVQLEPLPPPLRRHFHLQINGESYGGNGAE